MNHSSSTRYQKHGSNDDDNDVDQANDAALDTAYGMQGNPMGQLGEYLLEQWALSPGMLWLSLVLGSLVPAYIYIKIAIPVIGVMEPLIELTPISPAGFRGVAYMSLALFILSAHVLWMQMDDVRRERVLRVYVNEGLNPELFKHNGRAKAMRRQFLREKEEARRQRNRASRHRRHRGHRPDTADHSLVHSRQNGE